MSLWTDFSDAQTQSNVIPKGTLAKVQMTLRPGGFDDPDQGWTDGYAKRGTTGSVYLDAEYTVMSGPYAKRKIWSMIGLYSPNGPNWAAMGRSFLRSVLNSARGLSDKDLSQVAQERRRISGFRDLDGLEFVARIDVGIDGMGEERNEIRSAVTVDHRDYANLMQGLAQNLTHPSNTPFAGSAHQAAYEGQAPAQSRPAWAG